MSAGLAIPGARANASPIGDPFELPRGGREESLNGPLRWRGDGQEDEEVEGERERSQSEVLVRPLW